MKKISLLFIAFAFTLFSNAQLALSKHDGTPINDGDVLTFTQLDEANAKLKFYIENTSSTNSIEAYLEVTDITNANGDNVDICINPTCIVAINEGDLLPETGPMNIAPNSVNSQFDYFWNKESGIDTSQNVSYTFTVYTISNGIPTGESIAFTYTYDSTTNTKNADLSNMGINVLNTYTKDFIHLKLQYPISVKTYDITGKTVKTSRLAAGNQQVNINNLNSGVYLLEFTNSNNKKATIKIVKQ
ncbi:T9SS type A sorting domain-containing protein [Mesonia sp. K7]|uniref:T9SS type A sorting domain-containing protein n=1 Tax=Mesonia sp. K7 TaxID=2218606 RepID=UPI000DA73E81|nr:T9SS type A sorting domain-containing protein [Mesonia sp. K7]PZD77246.1 hypothetical protein DNG35_09240 [Mesonia sp. K7]